VVPSSHDGRSYGPRRSGPWPERINSLTGMGQP
jgi:hypothetical protein